MTLHDFFAGRETDTGSRVLLLTVKTLKYVEDSPELRRIDTDAIVPYGAGYKLSEGLSVDVAYMHLFVKDSAIRKPATGENLFRGGLSGSYDSSIDIVSAEITWMF